MMKNKSLFLPVLLSVIGIGLFSLIALLLVNDRSQAFWITYAFTVVAFVLVGCVRVSFSTDKYSQSTGVWTYPTMILGAVYLIAQIIVAMVLIASSASVKVAVIVQILLLVAYGVSVLIVSAAKTGAQLSDRDGEESMSGFATLAKEAESLYVSEEDASKKKYLHKIYEAIRYSDYVSNTPELRLLDAEIAQNLVCLRDSEQFEPDAEKLLRLIAKRNVVCKSSK